MRASNRRIGNQFEREFCETLASYGFWVHNLAQSDLGQPADMIAVREGRAYLIDCKACDGRYFSRNRIEENQMCAMSVWKECYNGDGWFAIRIMGEVFMISLSSLVAEQKVNLDYEWFLEHAFAFREWIDKS